MSLGIAPDGTKRGIGPGSGCYAECDASSDTIADSGAKYYSGRGAQPNGIGADCGLDPWRTKDRPQRSTESSSDTGTEANPSCAAEHSQCGTEFSSPCWTKAWSKAIRDSRITKDRAKCDSGIATPTGIANDNAGPRTEGECGSRRGAKRSSQHRIWTTAPSRLAPPRTEDDYGSGMGTKCGSQHRIWATAPSRLAYPSAYPRTEGECSSGRSAKRGPHRHNYWATASPGIHAPTHARSRGDTTTRSECCNRATASPGICSPATARFRGDTKTRSGHRIWATASPRICSPATICTPATKGGDGSRRSPADSTERSKRANSPGAKG